MPVDREAVRSNAKYLRHVRPIDPTEIASYVPGNPDPRVIRQVLREEAVDLGIGERPDGTFVPVPAEAVDLAFDGVTALPDRYESLVTDLLVEQYGPEWHRGERGEAIRERIHRLKDEYYRQHPVEYDLDVALAYAIYHLPTTYAATQYVLADLGADGLVPRRLRVLDVGAGVGAPALGLHDLVLGEPNRGAAESDSHPQARTAPPAVIEYHAVEPSAASTVLERALSHSGRNFQYTIHEETAESFDPPGAFDILLFSKVLSELDDPVAVTHSYLDSLSEDGTLVAIAPADRNTSLTLRRVERQLEERGTTIYGPTVRLWPGERPTDEGWSFDERDPIELPSFQAQLSDGAERPAALRHTDVRFSYVFARTDGRRRYDVDLSGAAVAKMAAMESHVSNRVDVVGAKLSQNLADEGHPLYKVSDGSESVGHFAVLVRETSLNRPLREAEYGDLLSFEGVLVLWNDDERAYNLVVDEETVVDPLG
ncbi:MAG: small ribosomal subunit Rsm22 family protein [Halodesulfurarchaeum sp.]